MKVSQLPEVQLVVQLHVYNYCTFFVVLPEVRYNLLYTYTYCTVQLHGDRDEFLVLGGITEVYVYVYTRTAVHVQFLFFFNPKNTNHLRRYQIRF